MHSTHVLHSHFAPTIDLSQRFDEDILKIKHKEKESGGDKEDCGVRLDTFQKTAQGPKGHAD